MCQTWGVNSTSTAPWATAGSSDPHREEPGGDLLDPLESLLAALSVTGLPLRTTGRDQGRAVRDRAEAQIADYLIPRARSLESPLTIVVGGSTGAGKSTVVNSLMRQVLTTSGVVRPTTRMPVLLHHPEDAAWMDRAHLLPQLERAAAEDHGEARNEGPSLLPRATPGVPQGIAIIDAPDIDSVSERNRALSRQLLDAADVWLFVTTANRYADAVPWEVLERAARRNITLAVALNRVGAQDAEEILADLRRLLAQRGLHPALLVPVLEQPRDQDGLLPQEAVAGLRSWLEDLGADARARRALAAASLGGAVRALTEDLGTLSAALEEQGEHRRFLADALFAPRQRAVAGVEDAISDGSLLRGEVLSRWQDFVGTGELFRRLESGIGRLRDRLANHLRGNPQRTAHLEAELETGLYRVIVNEAARAAETAQATWYRDPAGRHLLEGQDLGELPEDFPARVQEQIRAWQKGIIAMMTSEGAEKRQRARFLSAGVNTGAVLLMIVVFSMTGGLTGIEIGIAGGAGALGWKILEAVFGEDAVRRMAATARRDLLERLDEVLQDVLRPFAELLPEDPGPGRERLDRLRAALGLAAQNLPGSIEPGPAEPSPAGTGTDAAAGEDHHA